MPLQDLTPTLRTRLSRLELLVGLFVGAATLLMLAGLGYYLYQRAERQGWFLRKMPYFTFVENAAGLNVGDKVTLMGFEAGEILEISPEEPGQYYNVYVQFQIREPYYGYLWDDSRARVAPADLLGKRSIEVTKGILGVPTYLFCERARVSLNAAASLVTEPGILLGQDIHARTGLVARASRPLTLTQLEALRDMGDPDVQVLFRNRELSVPSALWNPREGRYEPIPKDSKGYFLEPNESPALTERLEAVINLVQTNLPHVLNLTNQIAALLADAARAVQRADTVLAAAQPLATNLAVISTHLREPRGSLGDWLVPTNLNHTLTQTLRAAHTTLTSATTLATNTDTRLETLVTNLNVSLANLANLTSNLHHQVQANTNLVTSLTRTIVQMDDFIQGLKRHWLLRSAFKEEEREPETKRPVTPLYSPRDERR